MGSNLQESLWGCGNILFYFFFFPGDGTCARKTPSRLAHRMIINHIDFGRGGGGGNKSRNHRCRIYINTYTYSEWEKNTNNLAGRSMRLGCVYSHDSYTRFHFSRPAKRIPRNGPTPLPVERYMRTDRQSEGDWRDRGDARFAFGARSSNYMPSWIVMIIGMSVQRIVKGASEVRTRHDTVGVRARVHFARETRRTKNATARKYSVGNIKGENL